MADIPESTKLLPCPVCSRQPQWRGTRSDYVRGIYRLQCLEGTHLFQAYGPSEESCIAAWNTRAAPPAMDREAVELDWRLVAKLAGDHGVRYRTNRAFEQFVTAILSTLSADAIRQGEGETLALRAIKAVTATAKDGAAGLSRIMAIASSAGVDQPYSELLQDPDVALIVERPRTEWAHLFKPGVEGCALPPDGWQCSRARGHSGPCAATPASHSSDGEKA